VNVGAVDPLNKEGLLETVARFAENVLDRQLLVLVSDSNSEEASLESLLSRYAFPDWLGGEIRVVFYG
jgi:hypothetical protein